MACPNSSSHFSHKHGAHCGHMAIRHNDHIDYLDEGHLHYPHGNHYDEHVIEVNATNPNTCVPVSICGAHVHGIGCGHEAIPHGDHTDYIVGDRLHYVHNGHCDDHGPVEVVQN